MLNSELYGEIEARILPVLPEDYRVKRPVRDHFLGIVELNEEFIVRAIGLRCPSEVIFYLTLE